MTEKCYICGSGTWSSRAGRLRDDPAIGVLECRGCGVVIPESRTRVEVDYRTGSMHGEVRPEIDAWRVACQPDDTRRFDAICEILRPGEGVLDFGCGSGGFLEMLRRRGVPSFGVELDESAVAHLRSSGLEVVTQLLHLTREMRANIQIVTLFHVLEHLRDPLQLIRALIDQLPDARTYIIEVPCAEDPLLNVIACPAFEAFTYWSHHEHLHSKKSLEVLLGRAFASVEVRRLQRYGLGNHLGWLATGRPDGQEKYPWLVESTADAEYRALLMAEGYSDTLWAVAENLF